MIKKIRDFFVAKITRHSSPSSESGMRCVILTLVRDPSNLEVTTGRLQSLRGDLDLHTLELPWKDNQQEKSCIPQGWYLCRYHNGSLFPDTWEICGVEGRSAVLIHEGNTIENTTGCILVGRKKGNLIGKKTNRKLPAVLDSKKALTDLKKFIGRDPSGRLNPFIINIV